MTTLATQNAHRSILLLAAETAANRKLYTMTLDSHPNPDFRETEKPAPRLTVTFAFHDDSKALAEAYIKGYDLGGGNFRDPEIIDRRTGQSIGRISYNGRFWPAGGAR